MKLFLLFSNFHSHFNATSHFNVQEIKFIKLLTKFKKGTAFHRVKFTAPIVKFLN